MKKFDRVYAVISVGLIVLSCACRSVRDVPATEILLRVDAHSTLRQVAKKLRVHAAVQTADGQEWVDRPAVTLDVSAEEARTKWPYDIPMVPLDHAHPPQLIQVVAEILNERGVPLVQQRVITSFIKQAQLVLEVSLTRCGERELGEICESDALCRGPECQNCVAGSCADTPVRKPESLPRVDTKVSSAPDGGTSDTRSGQMEIPDAATVDGEQKGAADGGDTMSAGEGEQGDAGAPSGSARAGRGGSGGAAGTPAKTPTNNSAKWSSPANLDLGSASVTGPSFAHNRRGDAVVGWWQDEFSGYWWFQRFVEGAWDEEPVHLSGASEVEGNNRLRSGIGLSSAGVVNAFVRAKADSFSDDRWQGYAVRWDGKAGEQKTDVVGDQRFIWPTYMTVSDEGPVFAVWGGQPENMQRPFYVNARGADGWGVPMQFGNFEETALFGFTGSFGNFLLMSTVGTSALKSFIGQGTAVHSPQPITFSGPVNDFRGTTDQAHNALIVALAGTEAPVQQAFWAYCEAQAETCSVPESIGAGPVEGTEVIAAGESKMYIFTNERLADATRSHVVVRTFEGLGMFGAPEVISDDFVVDESRLIAWANASGDVVVVWLQKIDLSDGTSGKAIGFNRFTSGSGWGKAGIVTSYTGESSLIGVTIDDKGRALVVWLNSSAPGEPYHLKWSRS